MDPFALDRSSPVPLYFQIAEQYEQAIVDGRLRPGDRLETEVALARQLGLSRPTVRQAIQLLVDKGLLVRKRGVGTQVVHAQVRRALELTSLFDDLSRAGQAPRTQILGLRRVSAEPAQAQPLQVAPGEPIWLLERLRLVGDEPLAVLRNCLRTGLVDLEAFDLERQGLYGSLRRAGISMSVARQRVGARRASPAEAALLSEDPGAPLLTMERTAYDNAGRVVEFGQHVYRPDLYSFETTLVQR
ncbi:GntR family transcriptional regulator [Kineosporia succinea]|uniref:DNA-binding GntR family transcriptional regulator n=1 Tax=Kineosporia succinea TaxID=84632 RepID=A0ABT9PG97_9ACTN|nr:GntR family transcriptional regulator [Kineosporia succinea]MDP9831165.1 DNA-binding GntR family transcriptional regulator [Kineosporia succinea]